MRVRRGILIVVAAGLVAAGCSQLGFIRRRLPPPEQTPNGVVFRFFSPSARVVQLAGNWPENDWLRGQAQTGSFLVGEMEDPDGNGIWERVEKLAPGRYQYKFVVDKVQWTPDPNNPERTDDGYGGHNSLLTVK
jgi:1,4-alpha-glucan branching enzyme